MLKEDISQTKKLTFSHDHSVFSIDFVALNFRHPEKIEYAYYLEGFEEDWNYVGSNYSATYTNLNPGEYTFKVKASNNDGIWNEQVASISIAVRPPFWATWWFRLMIIGVLGGAVFGIYKYRVGRIKARQLQLEKEIRLRTQELEEQKNKLVEVANQLKNANDEVHEINSELTAKNREIQQFTYAVSHDLKSPISTIAGFAGFIAQDIQAKKYDEIQEHLNYINTACDSMQSLIADITEIAKLGKVDNKIEKLDTNEIAVLAINMVKGKLEKKRASTQIQDNLPPIQGDKNRITQVFENLIDNAIKYMGSQVQPVIEIGATMERSNVLFFVKDNGAGIEPKFQQQIFQPFERLDRSVEGSGLGLAMIQKVIESHGGKLWVESEGEGRGSTFFFSIPN